MYSQWFLLGICISAWKIDNWRQKIKYRIKSIRISDVEIKVRKEAISDWILLLALYYHHENGGSIKFIFICPIVLYSSSVLFITGESVNFPFWTSLSLPSSTQFIIPGSSREIISFAKLGLILFLGIYTLNDAIKNLR